jgi:hypothetical protein
MPVAAENRPSLDALFSYRVCAVSFNRALQQTGLSLNLRLRFGARN